MSSICTALSITIRRLNRSWKVWRWRKQLQSVLRITRLKGDPTLYNLSFQGSSIDLEIDRSKNKDRGKDPVKTTMTCTDLVEEEGQQLFVYTLKGCDSSAESFTILSVAKEHVDEHIH